MECVLERGSREQNSSAHSGAVGVGLNVEIAAELSHTFAHAGNANAVAGRPEGLAIFGWEHALAVVGDFENDGIHIFAERNACLLAAGVALDVGEAFLSDAKEGGLD